MLHSGSLVWESEVTKRVGDICCFDYLRDYVAVGTATGSILFYRISSGDVRARAALERTVTPPVSERALRVKVVKLKFSPCFRYIAAGLVNGTVIVFDINNFQNLRIINQHSEHKGYPVTALCWTVDSCKLYSGCVQGRLIELNCHDNPSLDIFTSVVSFFGASNTIFVGNCGMEIMDIDTTYSVATESPSESGDAVLVTCASYHLFHFKLPRHGIKQAKAIDITTYIQKFSPDHRNGQVTCGCFIPVQYSAPSAPSPLPTPQGTSTRGIPRYALLLASQTAAATTTLLQCHTGSTEVTPITLHSCGNRDNRVDQMIGPSFRILRPLLKQSQSGIRVTGEPPLLIALTSTNRLALIHLSSQSYHVIDMFESVWSFALGGDRVLVLHGQKEKVISMVTILHTPAVRLPIPIIGLFLNMALRHFQQQWRARHAERHAFVSAVLGTPAGVGEMVPNIPPPGRPMTVTLTDDIHQLETSIRMCLLETDTELEHLSLDLDIPALDIDSPLITGPSRWTNQVLSPPAVPGRDGTCLGSDAGQGDTPGSRWGERDDKSGHHTDRVDVLNLSENGGVCVDVPPPVSSSLQLSVDKLHSIGHHFEIIEMSRYQFYVDLVRLVDLVDRYCNCMRVGNYKDGWVLRQQLATVLTTDRHMDAEDDIDTDVTLAHPALSPDPLSQHDTLITSVLNDEVDACLMLTAILCHTLETSNYDISSKLLQPNRCGNEIVLPNSTFCISPFRQNSAHRLRSVDDILADTDSLLQHTEEVLHAFDVVHGGSNVTEWQADRIRRRRSRSFGSSAMVPPGGAAVRPSLTRTFGSDSCLMNAGGVNEADGGEGGGRDVDRVRGMDYDKLQDEIVGVEIMFESCSEGEGGGDIGSDGRDESDHSGYPNGWDGEGRCALDLTGNGITCNGTTPQAPPSSKNTDVDIMGEGEGESGGGEEGEGEDPDWLHSTGEVWLDRWNDAGASTNTMDLFEVKTRVCNRRRNRRVWRDGGSGGATVGVEVVGVDVPLGIFCKDLNEQSHRNIATYEVTIPCGCHGVGMNFCMRNDNLITVHEFCIFPLDCPNYAKLSGLIAIGDILVAVNDQYLTGMCRDRAFEVLRSLAAFSKNVRWHYAYIIC